MKKILLFGLSAFLFASSSLFAEDTNDAASAQIVETPETNSFYPLNLSGGYLSVGSADFWSDELEGQTLKYSQQQAAFTYTHMFSPCWGLLFGAGYIGSNVDWNENPYFTETDFTYVSFSLGGVTRSYEDWQWTALLSMLIDTYTLDLGHYALYQGTLWGKYALCEPIILHVGFILEVGLNKDKIWPILGFEYSGYDSWTLHAVYPINIEFDYYLSQSWTVAAGLRFLRNRHRVSEDDPLPMGIFEYHTWGGELDLYYNPLDWFFIKGFVGSTFGGDLKITNRNDHHAHHEKFDGSFYIGGSAELNF